MKEAFFWCYPWDLEDEGMGESLARLRGEIGVDAISIAAASGPIHELRPRLPAESRVFHSAAGVNFQPTAKFYSGIQLKPAVAHWMKSRNPIAKICEGATKERLRVRGWLSCCNSDSLAHRHPHAACVNAFGEVSQVRLCPAHPEVREYLAAVVEDLATQYPVETIELDEACFGRAWPWYAQASFAPTDALRTLMQWCFCPACRQRAGDLGVDAHAAMKGIQARLDRATKNAQDADESIEDIVGSDAHLKSYQTLREESITSLLKTLRARIRNRIVMHVCGSRLLTGMDIASLMEHCDALVCPFTGGKPAISIDLNSRKLAPERWEAHHACYPPLAPNSAALVAAVHESVSAGIERVGFSNYGFVSSDSLEWVRQAIRYARREV
jgi:hypothetical protein